jgi:hypothetical protein
MIIIYIAYITNAIIFSVQGAYFPYDISSLVLGQ